MTGRHLAAVVRATGLLVMLFIAVAHSESYPTQYVATVWQTEQGLSQNSLYDMVQDHDGYLWLATSGGIVRFEGVRFRVFGAADIPSLRSLEVTSLHQSRSGDLWIGTLASGLIRLHGGIAATYTESGAGTEVELTAPARIAYGTARRGLGLRLFRKIKVKS